MKLKLFAALLFLIILNSCSSSKTISDQPKTENMVTEISSITNKTPYDPRSRMTELRKQNERRKSSGKIKLK